jgi:hypothetical protein
MWSFQAEVYCVHKTHAGFRVTAVESIPVIQGPGRPHIDVTMGHMAQLLQHTFLLIFYAWSSI